MCEQGIEDACGQKEMAEKGKPEEVEADTCRNEREPDGPIPSRRIRYADEGHRPSVRVVVQVGGDSRHRDLCAL